MVFCKPLHCSFGCLLNPYYPTTRQAPTMKSSAASNRSFSPNLSCICPLSIYPINPYQLPCSNFKKAFLQYNAPPKVCHNRNSVWRQTWFGLFIKCLHVCRKVSLFSTDQSTFIHLFGVCLACGQMFFFHRGMLDTSSHLSENLESSSRVTMDLKILRNL